MVDWLVGTGLARETVKDAAVTAVSQAVAVVANSEAEDVPQCNAIVAVDVQPRVAEVEPPKKGKQRDRHDHHLQNCVRCRGCADGWENV